MMPHVRERQPNPDEVPDSTRGDDAPSSGLADITTDPNRTPGRVNADEAVTGTRAGSSGESPAGGIPGDDSSLQGGDPA
jgi:hypothetical protein